MTETPEVRSLPPEARAVQGRAAGPVTRGLANVIDATLILVVLIATGSAWSLLAEARHFTGDRSPLLLIGLSGSVAWFYLSVSWATVGRTYGQGLLGLRVVTTGGRPLPLVRALIRGWLSVWIPVLWFTLLVDRSSRHLIDRLVGSVVVYDWQRRHAPEPPSAGGP